MARIQIKDLGGDKAELSPDEMDRVVGGALSAPTLTTATLSPKTINTRFVGSAVSGTFDVDLAAHRYT